MNGGKNIYITTAIVGKNINSTELIVIIAALDYVKKKIKILPANQSKVLSVFLYA